MSDTLIIILVLTFLTFLIDKISSQNKILSRHFDLVIETLPIGLWVIDAKGNIVSCNKEGRKIWGGAKFVGIPQFHEYKGWWLESGKKIEPEEWGAARAIQKRETSIHELIQIEAFDGTRKIIAHSSAPVLDDKNEVLGAVIVNIDMTERFKKDREREEMIGELQEALSKVKTLSGLLPICASCKKIRDDKGYWERIEVYLSHQADVSFSHGLCPDCFERYKREPHL